MRQDFGKLIWWSAVFAAIFVWSTYSWKYMGGMVGGGNQVTGITDFFTQIFPFIKPYLPTVMKITYWMASIGAVIVAIVIFFILLRLVLRIGYRILKVTTLLIKILAWVIAKPLTKQRKPFPINIKETYRTAWAYTTNIAKGVDDKNKRRCSL
jgi:hypothetical protein